MVHNFLKLSDAEFIINVPALASAPFSKYRFRSLRHLCHLPQEGWGNSVWVLPSAYTAQLAIEATKQTWSLRKEYLAELSSCLQRPPWPTPVPATYSSFSSSFLQKTNQAALQQEEWEEESSM